jgi:hypothetical protein
MTDLEKQFRHIMQLLSLQHEHKLQHASLVLCENGAVAVILNCQFNGGILLQGTPAGVAHCLLRRATNAISESGPVKAAAAEVIRKLTLGELPPRFRVSEQRPAEEQKVLVGYAGIDEWESAVYRDGKFWKRVGDEWHQAGVADGSGDVWMDAPPRIPSRSEPFAPPALPIDHRELDREQLCERCGYRRADHYGSAMGNAFCDSEGVEEFCDGIEGEKNAAKDSSSDTEAQTKES